MQTSVNDGDNLHRSQRRVIWAMTVILGISLITNLVLAYRLRKANVALASVPTLPSPPPTLPVGTSVQPLKVSSLEGRQEVISYADSQVPIVLYVFTPECSWCTRNLDNIKSLASQKQGAYRFIALSLSNNGVKEYAAQSKLDLPIFVGLAEEARQEYKLGTTPQTIVVSSEGKILQNWIGAYVGRQQTEVESFFGVHLPGITSGK